MYYVYVLKSLLETNWLYIGYSNNLRQRIIRHQQGGVKSTKNKRPMMLVYYEAYLNKADATKRERQLKGHKAKEDLKTQIRYSLAR